MTSQPDLFLPPTTIQIPFNGLDAWLLQNPDKQIIACSGIGQAIRDHAWTIRWKFKQTKLWKPAQTAENESKTVKHSL